jgi:hypothetical protein
MPRQPETQATFDEAPPPPEPTPQPQVEPAPPPVAAAAPMPIPPPETGTELAKAAADPGRAISVFANIDNFKGAQRMAVALSQSSLVPAQYQGPANLPNVLIAMELASRIGTSVLMTMQNLDVIHGRPSWRASFLIATVNASRRFTPLRFRWQGKEFSDDWGARCYAKDLTNGEECVGALITIGLAKSEQWYQRNGSKWKTLPEQMIMYRAASFWTRVFAPELSLGMSTAEEVIDTTGEEVAMPTGIAPGNVGSLEAALRSREPAVVNGGA